MTGASTSPFPSARVGSTCDPRRCRFVAIGTATPRVLPLSKRRRLPHLDATARSSVSLLVRRGYADIGITALMPSGRLCRDGVTRMHVFPAQEEIDLAVTRHNRRPIADLHHLRRGSYWRSATVIKRAGDRGELTPNPSCVRQWQMRPYLSAAQSRAAAASHLRWRSSRPSQQCVLLCRVARHAKSR